CSNSIWLGTASVFFLVKRGIATLAMGSRYGNTAFNATNHVAAMYEPLTFGHEANLTAAISVRCSSGETSAWSWNQSIIQATRRDTATPPASWHLPLGHHGACERLRRSRSRLPIAGR